MAAPGKDALGRFVPTVPADHLRSVWLLARREFGEEFPGVVVWFGLTSR
ncbi:hypothetical protein SAMN04489712_12816 [Thermomonospora echinospora]|uniref:Uncharacterized protein n=1 Tax=Thermomonospora echinospora TaxID=1992 RepID=A0A1H6E0B9_9ACTN|nr:hypothetical protein [Thermomonospora echinospora]SEG91022.1 hypothetical protein SAMN04489712_12816 [Thermomonospora echinospora]